MPDNVQLPDPSQYATSNQLQQQRLVAQSLVGGGLGNITPSPGTGAVSGWQGIGGVLQALVGKRMFSQAAEQERLNNLAAAQNAPAAPGEPAQSQPSPPSSGGPLTMQPPTGNATGYSDPISRYAAATASQEGSGSYNQVGPVTKNPMTGQPDRAYGKYQVMGANVPQWTKDVLGTSLTPQQFLQSPDAQEAVYRTKFGQLTQKYGPEGAAKAWFAGEGGMNNPNATDVNGMTVARYGQNFDKALAFNGEPSNAPPGAPPQGGPTGPMTTPPPGAQGSPALAMQRPPAGLPGPAMEPAMRGAGAGDQPTGTLPMRPTVTREQFVATMANPQASPAQKQAVSDMYYSQNQPLQVQGAYGSTVVVNPRDPSQRWVIPPEVHWGDTRAGDVSVPTPITVTPRGSSVGPPAIGFPASSGGGASGAPPPQSPGPGATEAPHDLVPPKPLPFAEEGGTQGAAQGGLPDIITKGPEAAQAQAQGQPQAGPLAQTPPYSFTSQPTPGAGAAPAVPAGEKVAQQGTPDLYSMSPSELANWSQNREIQTQAAKDFNSGDITNYNKDYTNYQSIGNKAVNAGTQIALAQQIIHDPHFTQGPGTDIKMAWEKAKAFMGDNAASTNVAYNQAFDKVVASNILGDMRAQLQGLGQVRLAEINLLNRASASQHNTLGANQAVLDIAAKSQQQLAELGKLTNWYRQGYRWDGDGHLVTDQSGVPAISNERPTSAGQNEIIHTYLSNNPLFNRDEIAHYQDIFNTDDKAGKGGSSGPLATKPPVPAPPPGFAPAPAAAPANQ